MESLTAGATLGERFRLVRPLGQGAAGEVWLATTDEGRDVALKVARADSAEAVRQLRAQFEQARRLVHPAIVRMHELVEAPAPFLVMQYVASGDVGALRGSGFRTVLAALLPVADALEHAHRQDVVHRDLKAANVLRDERGACFVADFGLGAFASGGTLPAMSPQQLAGAAPAPSDDVYAFGALLYDLLTGQPLFHPDVSPERIRAETPAIPVNDLTGEALPDALRRLLSSLLQKEPALRPAGMGTVRHALEELLREHAPADSALAIRPLGRAQPAAFIEGATHTPLQRKGGLRRQPVYVALAVCAALVLLVVLYLPTLVPVSEPAGAARSPGREAAATEPPAGAAADASAVRNAAGARGELRAEPETQATVDEALARFLRAEESLKGARAERWGGDDWEEFRRLATAADDLYKRREQSAAAAAYVSAAAAGEQLAASATARHAEALTAGEAALAAGDGPRAIAGFETALAIQESDARARRGLERARNLDELLAAMTAASAAEIAGRRDEALAQFRRAAALDPQWQPATDGVARLEQVAARTRYEERMAAGYGAQASGNAEGARTAFAEALRVRPGDAQATAALAQLDADRKLGELASLQSQAQALAAAERWSDALARYDAVLAADANLAQARTERERVRSMLELDGALQRALDSAERFNDAAVMRTAEAVLATARAASGAGPQMRSKTAELERRLQEAQVPVRVTLESDNLTEVTLFKVGRLGTFTQRMLELRPGEYTVVGSRAGYRDVRRSFRVAADQANPPAVVVRCEEPI